MREVNNMEGQGQQIAPVVFEELVQANTDFPQVNTVIGPAFGLALWEEKGDRLPRLDEWLRLRISDKQLKEMQSRADEAAHERMGITVTERQYRQFWEQQKFEMIRTVLALWNTVAPGKPPTVPYFSRYYGEIQGGKSGEAGEKRLNKYLQFKSADQGDLELVGDMLQVMVTAARERGQDVQKTHWQELEALRNRPGGYERHELVALVQRNGQAMKDIMVAALREKYPQYGFHDL